MNCMDESDENSNSSARHWPFYVRIPSSQNIFLMLALWPGHIRNSIMTAIMIRCWVFAVVDPKVVIKTMVKGRVYKLHFQFEWV